MRYFSVKRVVKRCLFFILFSYLPFVALAAPIVIFQTDGDSAADFNGMNLQTIGSVEFGASLASIFGRDTDLANSPLSPGDRYANDFLGTLADDQFLASSDYFRHQSSGILFSMGGFNNDTPMSSSQLLSGLSFTVSIPEQLGLSNRRLNLQFGEGLNGGGPADIGGGPDGAGRKSVLRAQLDNIPGNAKVWGQFINNQTFEKEDYDLDGDGEIDEVEEFFLRFDLQQRVDDEKKRRAAASGRPEPREFIYAPLVDRTRFVDPIESFYFDFDNDDGSAFEFDIDLLFANDLFGDLAQLLDSLTIEIGVLGDFPETYDDEVNLAFLGTAPTTIDLGMVAQGQNPTATIGSIDFVRVPEPSVTILIIASLFGLIYSRRKVKNNQ